ncbi:MAG TPA: 50S ribosomal protein L15 [Candidatus Paceibacterota bacterium]|nr:50S ribosomal protein L15 [Candidatus Paceibacterota bacterium]
MQLHDLKKGKNKKKKKRVGRGGKRGTYSGRGIKGQKARAGHSIPSKMKRIVQKFPKLRGVKFNSHKKDTKVLNVSDLENMFDSEEITKESFIEAGVIKNMSDPVKILGDGKLDKKFIIKGVPVSQSAKKKIEKAGGEVVESKK